MRGLLLTIALAGCGPELSVSRLVTCGLSADDAVIGSYALCTGYEDQAAWVARSGGAPLVVVRGDPTCSLYLDHVVRGGVWLQTGHQRLTEEWSTGESSETNGARAGAVAARVERFTGPTFGLMVSYGASCPCAGVSCPCAGVSCRGPGLGAAGAGAPCHLAALEEVQQRLSRVLGSALDGGAGGDVGGDGLGGADAVPDGGEGVADPLLVDGE